MAPLFLLLAPLAGAVYPAPRDEQVNDFAGVLEPADAARARAAAERVLRERGVPIVVATIDSLAAQGAGNWSIERYATNLYNEWGIGARGSNRGVLILIAVRDRKLRIATGAGLGNLEGPSRQVIDGTIVPRFKAGDLSGGIAAGVEAVAAWFGSGAPVAEMPPEGIPPERVPPGESARWSPHGTGVIRNQEKGGGISPLFKFILVAVGIFLVISLLRSFRRARGADGYSGGGYGGGFGGYGYGGAPRSGGWGSFLLGGLAGFLGSRLLQGSRQREWGGGESFRGGSGSSSSGGGFFSGGGSSSGGGSFGGGHSSGGGASGSW